MLKARIKKKIEEITQFLDELDSIKPDSLDDYIKGIKEKAACERYIEKIMEACTDLCFLIIRERKLETPSDDISAFEILHESRIITELTFLKLKDAKGMKNIISHQYGNIDEEIVFNSITYEMNVDIGRFLDEVNNLN